jgi:hypothetical protein
MVEDGPVVIQPKDDLKINGHTFKAPKITLSGNMADKIASATLVLIDPTSL